MITIETNRLLLRNYKVTDFEDILKYFSDEEVSKFEDFYPMSEEQVRNIIACYLLNIVFSHGSQY